MRSLRGLLVFAFGCALFASPALAHQHSDENCDMHQMNASATTNDLGHIHVTHKASADVAVSAEEIPAVHAKGSNPCVSHAEMLDGAIVYLKMSHCEKHDCCLKSGGPLSSGHKAKTIGQEDHLLVRESSATQDYKRFSSFEPVVFHVLQGEPSPIPRPPSA